MATSGTFTGSRGGNSYGPWLTLTWSRIQEDIPNNRSLLRLTLKLNADSPYNPIRFSGSKTGNLEGQSFTYTGGMNGNGTVTVKTRDMWVNHNSDGSKSITLNATLNINLTWSGSPLSSISVSGTANIDTIPRASDFTAFTLSNTVLNTSAATTINYTLGRKSTAFSQDMTLKIGSKVIASWNTASTGALTRTLSATEVNNIIKAMPNSTSATLTLTMQTKSGSTNIGSAKTINEGISLNSAIKPSASGLSVSIAGSGRDKTIGMYVQGISKVQASFTRSAGYGASISTNTIEVKKSDGKNPQTIPSNSGTTANAVGLSGTYTITATVKDSRGRTASVSTSITVQAYSPPRIVTFSTARRLSPTSTVDAVISAAWSPLGTSNPATVTLVRKDKAGASSTLYTLSSSTAGTLSTTRVLTSQSDASSYDYILTVTDSFGKTAPATQNVGSSFVELSIARGKGIGVGKVHEDGALDIYGQVYIGTENSTGRLIFDGAPQEGLDELRIIQHFGDAAVSHLWFRADAAGFWDKTANNGSGKGIWRYDLETKLFSIQSEGGTEVRGVLNVTSDIVLGRDLLIQGTGYITADNQIQLQGQDGSSFWVGGDGQPRISSMSIYDRTYSGQSDVCITTYGTLGRRTSASKYKLDIRPVETDIIANRILDLHPKKWYDKTATEQYAEYLTRINTGEDAQLVDVPYLDTYYGLIAEDLIDVGLEQYVNYGAPNENGVREVEGIAYDRLWTLLIPVVRELKGTVRELKGTTSELENKIATLGG